MTRTLTLVTLSASMLVFTVGCKNNQKASQASAQATTENAAEVAKPSAQAKETTQETAPAAPKKLAVGDKAPALTIDHVIKGEGVTSFDGDRVYVVEFWATWCPPCRTSMPHLSKLQDEHSSDVTIIGVSDEDVETIQEFLAEDGPNGKTWDANVRYVLTTDLDNSMSDSYMKAASQRGIPTAFIVDRDENLVWIGHPMNMDSVLPKVVDGTWDVDEARKQAEAARKQEERMEEMNQRLMTARSSGDWDTYLKILNEMNEEMPNNSGLMMAIFDTMIMHTDRKAEAYALADKIIAMDKENAQLYNSLAWAVATEADTKCQNLDWAEKTALKANELSGGENAAILDTVARIYYEQGNMKDAIAWQKKAVEHAPSGEMGDDIRVMLERYETEAGEATTTANVDE